MGQWTEVAERCFVARYQPYDVTVGAVAGADGLAVIDTRSTEAEGRELLNDLASLWSSISAGPATSGPVPIRAVINTHAHFDHCFGNAAFVPAPIVGHRTLPDRLTSDPPTEPTTVVAPTETFESVRAIWLGDRRIELVHPGRGHTDGDVVAVVPDIEVLFAGDLVEQAGPPAYGDDSYPLEWPASVEITINLIAGGWTVVPGHGAPVGRDFVVAQHGDLLTVSETIRDLWSSAVPEAEALAAGAERWPFPVEGLGDAVARGYAGLRGRAEPLKVVGDGN